MSMQREIEETHENVGEHERSNVGPDVRLRRDQVAGVKEKGAGDHGLGLRAKRQERLPRRGGDRIGDSPSARETGMAPVDRPRGAPAYWVCESAR